MNIPTAEELDAWVEMLRGGYASKEMLPRVIEGYKRLLRVAEMARPCVALDDGGAWAIVMDDLLACPRLEELSLAFDALDAPIPEVSP